MIFRLKEAIQILERTPKVLRILLHGLNESWIYNNEGLSTWSPYDVVGHLIHGEKTDWIPRAKRILDDEHEKEFEPFDRFAQFMESRRKSMDQLLNEFHLLRKKNVTELQNMDIDATKLRMTGIHPEFGQVTLRQLLATWVAHDLSHINQITRVLAKNYQAEVGPWIKYISILQKS